MFTAEYGLWQPYCLQHGRATIFFLVLWVVILLSALRRQKDDDRLYFLVTLPLTIDFSSFQGRERPRKPTGTHSQANRAARITSGNSR
jgi:hypothetical protein